MRRPKRKAITRIRTILPEATFRMLAKSNSILDDMLGPMDIVDHLIGFQRRTALVLADHEIITRAIAEINNLRKASRKKRR